MHIKERNRACECLNQNMSLCYNAARQLLLTPVGFVYVCTRHATLIRSRMTVHRDSTVKPAWRSCTAKGGLEIPKFSETTDRVNTHVQLARKRRYDGKSFIAGKEVKLARVWQKPSVACDCIVPRTGEPCKALAGKCTLQLPGGRDIHVCTVHRKLILALLVTVDLDPAEWYWRSCRRPACLLDVETRNRTVAEVLDKAVATNENIGKLTDALDEVKVEPLDEVKITIELLEQLAGAVEPGAQEDTDVALRVKGDRVVSGSVTRIFKAEES